MEVGREERRERGRREGREEGSEGGKSGVNKEELSVTINRVSLTQSWDP